MSMLFLFSLLCYSHQENAIITIGSFYSKDHYIPISPSWHQIFCDEKNNVNYSFFSFLEISGHSECIIDINHNEDNHFVKISQLNRKDREMLKTLIDYDYDYHFYLDGDPMLHHNAKVGYVNNDGKHILFNSISFDVIHNIFSVSFDSTLNNTEDFLVENLQELHLHFQITNLQNESTLNEKNSEKIEYNFSFCWVLFLTLASILAFYIIVLKHILKSLKFDNIHAFAEKGWLALKNDVFRLPPDSRIIARNLGWGFQLLLAFFICFLQRTNKNEMQVPQIVSLYITKLISSAIMGGFLSGIAYKKIRPKFALLEYFHASIRLPVFVIMFIFLLIIASPNYSSISISFESLIAFVSFDFILFYCGCFFGKMMLKPIKTGNFSKNRRLFQKNKFLLGRYLCPPAALFLFLSMIPQINILLEISWHGKSFSNFSTFRLFLDLVFSFIQTALIGIIISYIKLKFEDWRWWWTSFWSGGMVGLFYIIYSIIYALFIMNAKGSESMLIFTIANTLIGVALSQVYGSISFLGSFFFIRKIYMNNERVFTLL